MASLSRAPGRKENQLIDRSIGYQLAKTADARLYFCLGHKAMQGADA